MTLVVAVVDGWGGRLRGELYYFSGTSTVTLAIEELSRRA